MAAPPERVPASDVERYHSAALEMADEARRIIRPALERGFDVKIKADASVVTDVDQAVERRLREMIAGWFPEHGVIGEEYPPTRPDSSVAVDPGSHRRHRGVRARHADVGRHPRPAPPRRADRGRDRPSRARPARERRSRAGRLPKRRAHPSGRRACRRAAREDPPGAERAPQLRAPHRRGAGVRCADPAVPRTTASSGRRTRRPPRSRAPSTRWWTCTTRSGTWPRARC